MDTIDSNTIESAAELLAHLDTDKTGSIHTVTLTLDGRTGGCLVTVESTLAADLTLVLT